MSRKWSPIPENFGKGESAKSKSDRRKRQALFERQDGLCHWCRKPMEMEQLRPTLYGRLVHNQTFATFEHLLPKSHGGWNHPENIVLAHGSCNNKRPKMKWPHDPIYGDGSNKLDIPPKPGYQPQKVVCREESINEVMAHAFLKAKNEGG